MPDSFTVTLTIPKRVVVQGVVILLVLTAGLATGKIIRPIRMPARIKQGQVAEARLSGVVIRSASSAFAQKIMLRLPGNPDLEPTHSDGRALTAETLAIQRTRLAAANEKEPAPEGRNATVTVALAAPQSIDCTIAKCIALTFDDGPDARVTPQILQILEQHQAVATFFVVGSRIGQGQTIVESIIRQGSEVGDHSWDHPALIALNDAAILQEINRTAQAIQQSSGVSPILLRPPYGLINDRVKKDSPYPLILWNVDTLDWKYPNPDAVFAKATANIRPGDIILMHDTHPTTAQALPRIIDTLQAQGFTLVTVGELLGITPANYATYASQTFFDRHE